VTKLFLHGLLAGEQAQLGAMKAGAEQLVDCMLKLLGAVENANCFADGAGLLFNRHCDFSRDPKRSLVRPNVSTRMRRLMPGPGATLFLCLSSISTSYKRI
jgi:hypothetical protein